MPPQKSIQEVLKRALKRGSEQDKVIVNNDEVKKKLQPSTESNHTRALAPWD
jgi:hypothetical protein